MMEKVTAGRDELGEFAPKFAQLNDDVLFGDVWSRQAELSPRDRSMVTVTALMASGILDSSLSFHIQNAKNHGVTAQEMAEILTHAAFYAGWPKADVGQTPWGSLLLEEAGQTAAYWADQMARACDLAQKEAGLEKAYGDSLQATRRSLEAFVQAAGTSWDEAARVEIVFPKLKAARGVEDPALQEQIKSIRARCKKAVEELTQTVSGPSAPLLADMALVYPAMLGLLDLVEDFSRAYETAKKQRSLLDFSDLEHLAVRLLVDEAGGPARPTMWIRSRGALPATMPMTRWDTSIWPLPLTGRVGCRCTTARPRRACGRRWRPWWTPCGRCWRRTPTGWPVKSFSRKTATTCAAGPRWPLA